MGQSGCASWIACQRSGQNRFDVKQREAGAEGILIREALFGKRAACATEGVRALRPAWGGNWLLQQEHTPSSLRDTHKSFSVEEISWTRFESVSLDSFGLCCFSTAFPDIQCLSGSSQPRLVFEIIEKSQVLAPSLLWRRNGFAAISATGSWTRGGEG
jgi:hypothetical protein